MSLLIECTACEGVGWVKDKTWQQCDKCLGHGALNKPDRGEARPILRGPTKPMPTD